jgi:putative transposase
MASVTTKHEHSQLETETGDGLFDNWFDPIEAGVREQIRGFIETMIESELEEALARPRYGRRAKAEAGEVEGPAGQGGHRHGHRSRTLMGSFGPVQLCVPRARLSAPCGKTTEWRSRVLPAYRRRTLQVDALIAGAYLAGTNTRRVRRALTGLSGAR